MRGRHLLPVALTVLLLVCGLASLSLAAPPATVFDEPSPAPVGRSDRGSLERHFLPHPEPGGSTSALPDTTPSTSTGTIFGRLTANSAPVAGQTLSLMRYSPDALEELVITTTTTITGYYQFNAVPGDGQTYFVMFGPNTANPAYVYIWSGPLVTDYSGGTQNGGELNIANTPLQTPPDGATVYLPAPFSWSVRSTSNDFYWVYIFDLDSGSTLWSLPVGYESSLTVELSDLDGVEFGKAYGWFVYTEPASGNAGDGFSFEKRRVTFSQPAPPATTTPSATEPPPTPSPTPTSNSRLLFLPYLLRGGPPSVR